MAELIDTRPQIVDIWHYAGDTLPIGVNTTDNFSTATWTGEVRLDHADATADATFSFVVDPGGSGAVAILSDVDTRALNDLGNPVTEDGKTFTRYEGIYDIQIEAVDGTVRTLFRGSIKIDSDVTRA